MKKKVTKSAKKKVTPRNNGVFCTECGHELDDFAFSKKSKNTKTVKENHENCVKSGKFSGEFCSKIFISDDNLLDEIWNKE